MSAVLVALLVLACTFGGSLVGMSLQRTLPEHHLDADSRDTIKLATGLIATMAALVLGLVISSAKEAFDRDDEAVKRSAAAILMLDRVLARYGPEAAPIRASVRDAMAARIALTWPEHAGAEKLDAPQLTQAGDRVVVQIQTLAPANDIQRQLQAEASSLIGEALRTRWSVLESVESSIPRPFLGILVLWLTLIFASFGLFAPRHRTVIAVLALAAMSVAAAIFLILEMDRPLDGLIRVSSGPYRFALEHLAQ